MFQIIRKRFKQIGIALGCFVLSLTAGFATLQKTDLVVTQADLVTYRTGANGAHSTYKSSKYYKHVTSIELTGDGVTDTLAVGLSQLGYSEGSSSDFSGVNGDLGGKTTEFVYNYGDADSSGYKMAWCASFCSWSIYQSQTADHSTHSQSCRNHLGDSTYIWRECGCDYWAQQLAKFSMYKTRGSYTPKAGDLIFFDLDANDWLDHIGFVLWCDGSAVYTVEGNRSNKVVLYRYDLSDTDITGYGVLPYPTNTSALKVDYSGRNNTVGQYITTNASLNVSATKGGSTSFTVGKYNMFNVTGFDGDYAVVEYNGNTGYATLNTSFSGVTSTDTLNTKQVQVTATESITVHEDSIKESSMAGGSGIPAENHNHSNPNVYIQGLSESVNSYKGLENYGRNKEKILINGRSWAKWEELFGEDVLENLWVYGAGSGNAYLGIEIKDNARLHLREYGGNGERLDTIVLKRGFQVINPLSDMWSSGEISSDEYVTIAGTLNENIILVANNKGGLNVVKGNDSSMRLEGYTFSEGSNGVEITPCNRDYVGYSKYTIVEADLHEDNSDNTKVTVKLLNNNTEAMSSIDLGYAWQGWTSINTDNAFLSHVKVNGKPIKEAYPNVILWVLPTGNGLCFEGMSLQSGDEVTIERGATFINGDIQMEMGYKYIFTYNGTTYDIEETGATESVGSGEFSIVNVGVYDSITNEEQISFKFMNTQDENATTVDLGYKKTGWTFIGQNDPFLDGIKVNGKPIKEVYGDVELWALETGCGLALKNVALKTGDILSIDKGAEFTHGGFAMTMKHRFAFRYDGATYEISDAFLDEVASRNYKIVAVSAYADDNCTSENLAFKLLSHTEEAYSNVNLGYPFDWTRLTDANTDMSFLSHVKVNGTPVLEKCPELKFWSMNMGYSLSLQGLGLTAGDAVTIEKGAVFANGDITAEMMQDFTFTFNGTGYDVTASEDAVNEYSIVKVGLYGDGETDSTKIAFKFLNNDNESASTVDFGHGKGWTELGTKIAFIDSILFNGEPIKSVYPNLAFWAFDGKGLAVQGISVKEGDVISIKQGAIFDNGEMSMEMQFEFRFTYNGSTYEIEREEHGFDWVVNGTEHYKQCDYCGYIDESTRDEHTMETLYDKETHYDICICGYKGNVTPHKFDWVMDGDEHYQACDCGYIDDSTRDEHTTNPSYDKETHYDICICGYKEDVTPHNFDWVVNGTEHYKQCDYCGYIDERTRDEHTMETSYDKETHYDICICGYKGNVTAHSLSWAMDNSWHYKQCDCGYIDESTRDEHTTNPSYDKETHYDICICGYKGNVTPHNFDWVVNGTEHYKQCDYCGYIDESTRDEHTTNPSYNTQMHYDICVCGYKENVTVHNFGWVVNGDEHYQTCACGYIDEDTVGVHIYQPSYNSKNHYEICVCKKIKMSSITSHEFSWMMAEEGHYQYCDCGYMDEDTIGRHELEDGVCKQCKYGESTSDESSEISSDSVEESTSDESSETSSDSVEESTSDESSETSSDSVEESTSDESSETSSDSVEESTSDESSEISSDSVEESTSDESSEISSDSVEESTSDESSEISSDSVEESTSDESSEISSDSVEESTSDESSEISSDSIEESSNRLVQGCKSSVGGLGAMACCITALGALVTVRKRR